MAESEPKNDIQVRKEFPCNNDRSCELFIFKLDLAEALIHPQVLVMTLALVHPPSRAYIDPWTGELFGEGGVEMDVLPHGNPLSSGISGDVIMPKLGNETAK